MILADIFALLTIIMGFLLVIGLIRPGFVVWWSERKSRGSVAAVWGTALVVCALGYMLTKSKDIDPNKEGSSLPTQTRTHSA